MKNLWFEVKEYSTWKVVCSNARYRRVVYLLVTVSSSFGQSLGNGRRTSSLFAFTVYSIKIKKLQSNMLGETSWNFFERNHVPPLSITSASRHSLVLLFLKFFIPRKKKRSVNDIYLVFNLSSVHSKMEKRKKFIIILRDES